MSNMTPEELMKRAATIGARVAQAIFTQRSKLRQNVEVHLSLKELAGACALAAELALKETLPAEEQAKLPVVLVAEPHCPECGAMPEVLGTLGSTTHYRCRNCGWTFSP